MRTVEVSCSVTIDPADNAPADWLTRVTGSDFPYKQFSGEPFTEQDGLDMLAYNAVSNGVEDASRLDGWGDLERGMLTMRVQDVEVER